MNSRWHICQVNELPVNKRLKFSIAPDVHVIVLHHEGRFIAFNQKCPHKGARMDNSLVAGDIVVCASHDYRFDLNTGHCINKVCAPLKLFTVEVEGDSLFLIVPSLIGA